MEHQFVVVSNLRETNQRSTRRVVRSVAARHVWARTALSREAKRQAAKRKKHAQVPPVEPVQHEEILESVHCEQEEHLQVSVWKSPLVTMLGAGRVDPFRSYPASYETYFPELVDHYITRMAVDIPELDQTGNRGLLRTSWFPFVLEAPSTFKVVMLLAATHLLSAQGRKGAVNVLRLKQEAIRSINSALTDGDSQSSDWMIGAVAKMASYEAIFGDVGSYLTHMNGLNQMIAMRGGLNSLGLAGLLRRIVIWIDINSGFLNGFPRYFPHATFSAEDLSVEPNPSRFVAV